MTAQKARTTTDIGDAPLREKTGKTWDQWFALLDEAGAVNMPHKDIAAMLSDQHAIPGWWAQTITVGYERARGLRDMYQTPSGYQASGSKTINAPLASLYEAWADEKKRGRWLPEPITVTKTTANKSLNAIWGDGRTRISAGFYAKADGPAGPKSQVGLSHMKLADADEAARMKAYWAEALGALKAMLEDAGSD